MKSSVIIIGAGGHAKVLCETLRALNIPVLGFVDKDPEAKKRHPSQLPPLLGNDEILKNYKTKEVRLVNGVGSVKTTELRKKIYERFTGQGYSFETVVHPSAILASDVVVEAGAQILAGAIVQTGSRIGENSIVNTGAIVDHDCVIGSHVHIATGAALSGGVRVGNETHFGTGAIAVQYISIGKGCLVAAGAVVTKDISAGMRMSGVPAREMKK